MNVTRITKYWSEFHPVEERISLNQKTCLGWTLPESIKTCAKYGMKWYGPRIDSLRTYGLRESRQLLDDCGMEISSVCFSGKYVHADRREYWKRLDECLRCIDDTAQVRGNVLVIMPGTDGKTSMEDCLKITEEGLEYLVKYAEKAGVILGLEPLHPMYAADLSALVTVRQAMDIIESINHPNLMLTLDVFHTWWDPELFLQIDRASRKICGFHVSDWAPIRFSTNSSRGMIGDGMIPIRRIRTALEKTEYYGPIEVEIFNEDLWRIPCAEMLKLCIERYREFV